MLCRLSIKHGHLKLLAPPPCHSDVHLCGLERHVFAAETKITHERLEKSQNIFFLAVTASKVALYAAPVFLLTSEPPSSPPSVRLLFSSACIENNPPF